MAKERKRKALAAALRDRPWGRRDKSTPGAPGDAKAFNRRMKAFDKAANSPSGPNPTRTIDKKTKVQYGRAH